MENLFPTFRRWRFSWWPWYTTAAQSQSLLRLIAVAIEEKLPLIPLLESWAADERGVQQLRLFRLVQMLYDGTPLPDALEQVPGVLHDPDALAVRFDSQSGTRTAAIRARLAELPDTMAARPAVRQTILYFCILLPIAVGIVAFLQASIMPVFQKILSEFSVPQPQVMEWSQTMARAAIGGWSLLAIAVLGLLWLAFLTRAGRHVRRILIGRLYNPWREVHAADVLQLLGVSERAGKPLNGALSTLARYYFDPVVRSKLLYVRNEVEQGTEVWPGLNAVGLLSLAELQLLDTAQRVGNRPWVLDQIIACKRRMAERRWERWGVLLLPLLVLPMGLFVLFQAMSVMVPLLEILRSI